MAWNPLDYEPIKIIEGEVLTEIAFVIDYYRLIFESKILTVLADPIIIQNRVKYSKDMIEYPYQFIQGITKKVVNIEIVEQEYIQFNLEGEFSIEIPYWSQTGAGIEVMIDIKDNTKWWAW
jgi:hypothetical protein